MIDRATMLVYTPGVDSKSVYKAKSAIVVLLFLAALVLLTPRIRLADGHGSRELQYKSRSFASMQGIAKAVADYAAAHQDNLPQKMSDLVPNYYLDDPKMLLFYSPDSNPVGHLDLKAHRELIDMFTAYGFLRLPDHRIVVFERPGFRNNYIIYIIQGNDGRSFGYLSSCSATPKEFTTLLSQGFPDVPRKDDYQVLYDCGIGSYEYELDIRGKKLQSIHNAFLASGRPPISSDAAHTQVQASMDKIDPPGTWLVEKGVRASDGSTPYYYFRCDYVKNPEEANPVDAYVLFDGTVLVPSKRARPPGA